MPTSSLVGDWNSTWLIFLNSYHGTNYNLTRGNTRQSFFSINPCHHGVPPFWTYTRRETRYGPSEGQVKIITHWHKELKSETLSSLRDEYAKDTDHRKLSLMAGVYRTELGDPFVLPSVKAVWSIQGSMKRIYSVPFLWKFLLNLCSGTMEAFRRSTLESRISSFSSWIAALSSAEPGFVLWKKQSTRGGGTVSPSRPTGLMTFFLFNPF